uniref:hypothetical protein n=1 Tax=Gracilaria cliftonii TaxID=206548 RepID=UPI001D11010E|nr:hypothetical protein LKZ11_pgp121 [Gracilaria cliftonii]UAD84562.1 hypothetical protein [Gracilaria cliftonii]
MNIFVFTGYLLSQPKLIKIKHQNFCYMLVSLNNLFDNISNIKIKAFAKGKIAKQIFDSYKEKNSLVIESSIYIKKISFLNKNKKKSKIVFVKIHKIQNIDT